MKPAEFPHTDFLRNPFLVTATDIAVLYGDAARENFVQAFELITKMAQAPLQPEWPGNAGNAFVQLQMQSARRLLDAHAKALGLLVQQSRGFGWNGA